MQRRIIDLETIDGVITEVDCLLATGYTQAGNWSLAQVCEHCGFLLEGALEGGMLKLMPLPMRMVTFIVRPLFGGMLLNKFLKQRGFSEGLTIPKSLVPIAPSGEDQVQVTQLKGLLLRFKTHDGILYPSPLFGRLTKERWEQLQIVHCSHHLGFLIPRKG